MLSNLNRKFLLIILQGVHALNHTFIVLRNSNCSETMCPTSGECYKHWHGYFGDKMIMDNSVSLTCAGIPNEIKS